MFSSASLVRALWQSLMDLLLCILLERFSNIPAVMFVNVKGMKEVVR